MKNELLVTTAIQGTWLKEKKIKRLFLTKACNLYSEKSDWEKLNYYNLKYHWEDREKLINDHDYLKFFYEEVLILLRFELNKIHNLNEDIDYWRIIIGPWLIHYIPIIYDKWETLRLAFKNDKFFSFVEIIQDQIIPDDFNDFIEILQTDDWNQQIYQRIINKNYNKRVDILKQLKRQKNRIKNYKIISKERILNIIDNFLKLFNSENAYFFHDSYFSLNKFIKLNFSLFQIPRFYSNDFSFNLNASVNKALRLKKINYNNQNAFEEFFLNNMFKDIPIQYLEGFSKTKQFIDKISYNPKVILTANSYWGKDVFKFWLAKRKNISKIVTVEHGGSFPPLFHSFHHEEDISDFYIYWFQSNKFNRIHLPPQKSFLKINKRGNNCSYIGFESTRFFYRIIATPITSSVLETFDQSIDLYNLLDPNIQKKFKIRPYPNMGWETSLRYKDELGEDKVDTKSSFKNFLINSKWIICSYSMTTFSEAMSTGTPTILLYMPEHNETIEETQELIKILKEVKIIFSDPNKAAKHLNKHWLNPNIWWESQEVIKARKLFFKMACNDKKNWHIDWVNFLKSL
jgi:putative transferase (TIGR04331 family)